MANEDTHHLMARFRRQAEYAAICRAVGEAPEADAMRDSPLVPGSAPADGLALRGIPVCGVKGGVGGATADSVPHRDAPSLSRRSRPPG
jgi:hypothetical protein